ncbi:MAG TPA: GNAT family N-acetyltransferase [Albitalea sp.]
MSTTEARCIAAALPRRAGGVLLRRLAATDLAAFQAYRQDPEVGRYQGWTATDDTQAAGFLAQMNTAALLQPGAWSQIGIADVDSGELVGDIGLLLASDGAQAEIGFSLARHAQRRGLGSAAVRAAIALVFQFTDARRIIGVTDARNLPSMRLLERVGMRQVESAPAMFRGEPCVELTYALARQGRHDSA